MEQWKYHNPVFECDELNYDLLRYAPWSGHRSFTYDLVTYFKPDIIVELGSHYGCSAFTFSQAIKDNKLNTKLYAVDTWAGDDYTKNDYEENDVYSIFKKTVSKYYNNQDFNMLRMTFDEALNNFEDKSIDILHIDGSHHYDDVKHDFNSWLPKVKEDGVILLHDISEDIVLGGKMGSNKFWNELKEIYSDTVEFDFSWGLGVIFLSKDKFESIRDVNLKKYQRENNELSVQYREELRKQHFTLKDNQYYIDSLKKQLEIKDSHLNKYSLDMNGKDEYINELKKDIDNWKENVDGKEKYIKELESNISILNKGLDDYAQNVQGKDNYIKELELKVKELEEEINKNILKRIFRK